MTEGEAKLNLNYEASSDDEEMPLMLGLSSTL